ncbi:unnamed protein product, partial [Brachionus calyciflorus]
MPRVHESRGDAAEAIIDEIAKNDIRNFDMKDLDDALTSDEFDVDDEEINVTSIVRFDLPLYEIDEPRHSYEQSQPYESIAPSITRISTRFKLIKDSHNCIQENENVVAVINKELSKKGEKKKKQPVTPKKYNLKNNKKELVILYLT